MSEQLFEVLKSVTGTGKFQVESETPYLPFGLQVEGVGELGCPIHPIIAQELIKVAEVAPYGKGSETIIDEAVRKCWQIDASKISFHFRQWDKVLSKIVKNVTKGLGIEAKVSAHLYKLLIYEEGGRFLPHRDTEKEDAMFGSLIISLPSQHTGGQLKVRHVGEEVVTDFSQPNPEADIRYAAFYADCEHEVAPVQSGYRICLVYNLCQKGGATGGFNLSVAQHAERIAPAFRQCDFSGLNAILLDHQYTEVNFSLEGLKNHDALKASALMTAAKSAGFDTYLALLVYHQSGELEGSWGYYKRYDESDSEEETMGEIYEEEYSLKHWITAKGEFLEFNPWSISEDAIVSNREIDSEDPIEKESEGYTGNAGCTMDYWYQHAAVVLWPQSQRYEVMAQYCFTESCQRLLQSPEKFKDQPFEKLAQAILKKLPQKSSYRDQEAIQNALQGLILRKKIDLLLEAMQQLGESLLEFDSADLWNNLVAVLPAQKWSIILKHLNEENKEKYREGVFALLKSLILQNPSEEVVETFVKTVLQHYPSVERSNSRGSFRHYSQRKAYPAVSESLIILQASCFISDSSIQQDCMTFLEHNMSLTHLRKTLIETLLHRDLSPDFFTDHSITPLFANRCIEILQQEVNREIHPFADWARPCPEFDNLSAKLQKELEEFMRDGSREEYEFKYKKEIRERVQQCITSHKLDLSYVTITKGSPHILKCTKTQESYLQKLKIRESDQTFLRALQHKYLR